MTGQSVPSDATDGAPEATEPPSGPEQRAAQPSALVESGRLDARTHALLLALIVLLGAALRLWHYDYEVGRQFTYDTGDKIAQALRVARGDLAPVNWKQPYFLPYVGGALLALARSFTEVDGRVAERLLTLLVIAMSVGAIVLTERVGTRAFRSPAIGLLSALLLAVVPINVIGSRYIKEDMPLVFFVELALLGMVGICQRAAWRDYVLAGLAVGAAIGTKFSGVLLGPTLLLAHALRVHFTSRNVKDLPAPRLFAALALVLVGFVVFNPYALVRSSDFIDGFLFQAKYSAGAHHDGTVISPWSHWWLFYFKRALVPGVTWVVVLAFVIALARLATTPQTRQNPALWLLVTWTLLCYVAFERATAKPFPFFARYVHPLVPALCTLGAWVLWDSARLLEPWFAGRRAAIARAACVMLAIAWPLAESVTITASIADDTRLIAARWIEQNLPSGARIGLDDPLYSPRPDGKRFELKYFGLIRRRIYDESVPGLYRKGFRYVVLNNFRTDRFRAAARDSNEAKRAFEFYRSVAKRSRLLQTIAPAWAFQTYGFHNPVIQIYELPASVDAS